MSNQFDESAFDFEYEEDANDDRMVRYEGRKGYPSITYHLGDSKNREPGFFTMDREASVNPPGPFWEEDRIVYGGNPDALPSPVWRTQRLRAIYVEERTRQVVTMKQPGKKDRWYYFNQYTKPAKRVDEYGNLLDGNLSFSKQILLVFPDLGISQPFALAANGLTKGTSWDNDPEGRFSVDNFPPGAKQQLLSYIEKADEARGMTHPFKAAWLIDLVPLYQNGKLVWIENYGKFFNPFTIDLRTAGQFKKKEEAEGFPRTRFVTGELHHALKDFYSAKAVPWQKEWDSFDNTRDNSGYDEGDPTYNRQEAVGVEEDEIPF